MTSPPPPSPGSGSGWLPAGLAVVLAALGAAVAWCLGADAWHAIGLGAGVSVVAFALAGLAAGMSRPDLGWRFEEWAGPGGGRDDLVELAESMGSAWGYVGAEAENRLKRLARGRLAQEGLDLRNPDHRAEIEARIGAAAYHTLVHEEILGIRLRALVGCLDGLAALGGPVDES